MCAFFAYERGATKPYFEMHPHLLRGTPRDKFTSLSSEFLKPQQRPWSQSQRARPFQPWTGSELFLGVERETWGVDRHEGPRGGHQGEALQHPTVLES